jgi:predicted RNase H-like nuclease (RuvC/YqgF family)
MITITSVIIDNGIPEDVKNLILFLQNKITDQEKSINKYKKTLEKCKKSINKYEEIIEKCKKSINKYEKTFEKCKKSINKYEEITKNCECKKIHNKKNSLRVKGDLKIIEMLLYKNKNSLSQYDFYQQKKSHSYIYTKIHYRIKK